MDETALTIFIVLLIALMFIDIGYIYGYWKFNIKEKNLIKALPWWGGTKKNLYWTISWSCARLFNLIPYIFISLNLSTRQAIGMIWLIMMIYSFVLVPIIEIWVKRIIIDNHLNTKKK